MLQDASIPRHQRRCCETNHLQEREIPRHHAQNHTERLIRYITPTGVSLDRLISQEILGMYRVVVADECALLHLIVRLSYRLTHLDRDHPAIISRALAK